MLKRFLGRLKDIFKEESEQERFNRWMSQAQSHEHVEWLERQWDIHNKNYQRM